MRRALLTVIRSCSPPAARARRHRPATPARAPHAQTLVVDARRGRDSNPGTARRPLQTVAAAWARIPQARALKRPVRILVRPGRYGARALPNYWERRWGTQKAPIVITAARRGTVTFALRQPVRPALGRLRRDHVLRPQRPLPLRACQHVLLTRSRLTGSASELHENVKVNQSPHIAITDSVISGAGDNAIDFVAVQYARITGNMIERRERLVRLRRRAARPSSWSPATASASAEPEASPPGRAPGCSS